MNKLFKLLLSGFLAFSLFGCGGNEEPKEKVFIEDKEIGSLYSKPDNFVGKYVKLTGKIFSIEEDGDDVFFQMWHDPINGKQNTIIMTTAEIFGDLKEDDYVELTGYVDGTYEGENMMGGTITAPQIVAEEVEKSSYKDVVAPTTKEVEINQTLNSNTSGVTVTLQKIEFADNETRAYVLIDNQSSDEYCFYLYESKLIQNSKQYTLEYNYEADYEQIETDIPSGVKEEGVLSFKNIDQASLQLMCEGHSDNWDIDSDLFVFNVEVE